MGLRETQRRMEEEEDEVNHSCLYLSQRKCVHVYKYISYVVIACQSETFTPVSSPCAAAADL